MTRQIFVGSSTEGLSLAEEVCAALRDEDVGTVWLWADHESQKKFFPPANRLLDAIVSVTAYCDVGVFVFGLDDKMEVKGEEKYVARDNVVFEYGLFTGAMGPGRAFVVCPDDRSFHILTDASGVIATKYRVPVKRDTLRKTCHPMCEAIQRLKIIRPLPEELAAEIKGDERTKLVLENVVRRNCASITEVIGNKKIRNDSRLQKLWQVAGRFQYLVTRGVFAIEDIEPDAKGRFVITEYGREVIKELDIG